MLINYNKFKFKTFKYPKSIILKIDNFLDKNFFDINLIRVFHAILFKKLYLKVILLSGWEPAYV